MCDDFPSLSLPLSLLFVSRSHSLSVSLCLLLCSRIQTAAGLCDLENDDDDVTTPLVPSSVSSSSLSSSSGILSGSILAGSSSSGKVSARFGPFS